MLGATRRGVPLRLTYQVPVGAPLNKRTSHASLPSRGRGGCRWLHRVIVVLAGTCLLASLLVGCSSPEPPGSSAPPPPAPGFTLPTVDGGSLALENFAGKVVLLDFWTTWCPPCRMSIPHLIDLQRRYRDDGLAVLGLNLDQKTETLLPFLTRTTFNYPVLRVDPATRAAYGGISSIPQMFVIDRKGKVRRKFMGFSDEIAREMEALIQTLLLEKP